MLLRQMKYFVAVVEYGSFTRAAEECYISQSAISQQIQGLEKELGVELLHRENRRFSLTPAGEYFYRHCNDIISQIEDLAKETARIGKDAELPLRIGYLEGYDGKELQETIYEFTALYPDVVLSIAKYSHEDLFINISNDRIDLVLSYQRRAFSQEYENYHLGYIPCLAEVSSRNPLAEAEYLDTEQLKNLTCIVIAKNEQRDLERNFYQNNLGIGRSYYYVENIADARLNVLGNRGFLPVADMGALSEDTMGITRLPILGRDKEPVQLNYCAFWKKSRSNYYIEEFVAMFHKRFGK